MAKYNFILIGTGWRALFYVRIAKALPEIFNLMAVYSRTSEKAEIFSKENGVHTTTSIEECKNLKPDFVVTAVKKSEGVKIAKQWLEYGFTVLAETPAGFDEENLKEVQKIQQEGKNLFFAEQYIFYPQEANAPKQSQIQIETRTLETEDTNPNLHFVTEIEKITFEGKTLYEPRFGLCGLGQDETAIATVMEGIGRFAKGEISSPYYSLEEAIMDSQMGLEMIG